MKQPTMFDTGADLPLFSQTPQPASVEPYAPQPSEGRQSAMLDMRPEFCIGDKVIATAFTDSSGKYHPDSEPLTVAEMNLREPKTLPPYYRIKAIGEGGFRYIEASERFFRLA